MVATEVVNPPWRFQGEAPIWRAGFAPRSKNISSRSSGRTHLSELTAPSHARRPLRPWKSRVTQKQIVGRMRAPGAPPSDTVGSAGDQAWLMIFRTRQTSAPSGPSSEPWPLSFSQTCPIEDDMGGPAEPQRSGLKTRFVETGCFSNIRAGRTGRRSNVLPQFGQRPCNLVSAQSWQNVHS
jgi:hypothetical protein